MPQLKLGSTRGCCCQIFRRGSAQTLRRTHWLAGLLFACICLTLAGFLNTEFLGSITTVPPFGLEKTFNTIHTADNDLDTPGAFLRSPPQTIVAYSLERQVEMEQREQIVCNNLLGMRPMSSQIHRINAYWQSPPHSGLHLFSAHYDARLDNYHYVRIISMVEGHRNASIYCQIWYDREVLVLEALRLDIWASQWDSNASIDSDNPVMFSCPVPRNISIDTVKRERFPLGVSVTMKPCESPRTFLPIHTPQISSSESRRDFAVCVKGLDFQRRDMSVRIAEWLELNLILGADKFFVYVYSVHPNLKRVLEYYSSIGVLEVIPLSLPGKQPNRPRQRSRYLKTNLWQKRRDELVPYNDCYYRNLYSHRFVLPVDVDEVIVPVKTSTWNAMFQELFSENPNLLDKYSSFSVRNAYFFDDFPVTDQSDVPKYHHILRHTTRSANFSPGLESVKSFVSTDGALTVFNHYTLRILRPSTARNLVLDINVAQMNHYRATCSSDTVPGCHNNFLKYKKRDALVLRYANQLRPSKCRTRAVDYRTPHGVNRRLHSNC
ncbi:uncharacterized protein LOC110837619 isoform X1 [Zootermopsis nevadensis]|uniref:uncharacterized protein LOC110837619 isoform X1 n=1 Tax=Zootermopsis nevadensis TaxID=136037 RepID=UPI000B8E560B|nr:uncharacterized protein LOC110837619 isoform X1 [Zootermopsis nevadensis]